jgi:hypothetical protein
MALGMGTHAFNPSTQEDEVGELRVQGQSGLQCTKKEGREGGRVERKTPHNKRQGKYP